jgi:RNA polymerase sigma factor (sigma-70 family)
MAKDTTSGMLAFVRRAVALFEGEGRTDAELLESFLARGDEAAFEALVRRYGPMVLGVCRRVLHHAQDAEDAFQATFLVLVRKAGSIARQGALAAWLYRVAHRTALRARALQDRRRCKEREAMDRARPQPADEPLWREVAPLLDQEVNRLPARYRGPLVLCDLQGKGRHEAARQLELPEGTLSSRLARGRALLRRRLARRGVALTSTMLAALLSQKVALAVPVQLVTSTVKAAVASLGPAAVAGAISAKVAALADGVARGLWLAPGKIGAIVLLAVGLVGAAVGAHQIGTRPVRAGSVSDGTNTPSLTLPVSPHPTLSPRGGEGRVRGAAEEVERTEWEDALSDPMPPRITVPPPELMCDPFYRKYLSAGGLPVLSSAKVSDQALYQAAEVIEGMLANRPDLLEALTDADVRVVVIHRTESVTDIPEKSHLRGKKCWDRRFRSTGGRITSCGEENLLALDGDRYRGQNVLVHELAHAIHLLGLNDLDETFDDTLQRIYRRAVAKGLWKDAVPLANYKEYWAEAVQCYFDANKQRCRPDGSLLPVSNREELAAYDPEMHALIDRVFRDPAWRDSRSDRRP